jgi:hypothetical protein
VSFPTGSSSNNATGNRENGNPNCCHHNRRDNDVLLVGSETQDKLREPKAGSVEVERSDSWQRRIAWSDRKQKERADQSGLNSESAENGMRE